MSLQSPEELECHDDNSQEDEGFMGMSPLLQAHHAMERMEEFVCKVRLQFLTTSFAIYLAFPKQTLKEGDSPLLIVLLRGKTMAG